VVFFLACVVVVAQAVALSSSRLRLCRTLLPRILHCSSIRHNRGEGVPRSLPVGFYCCSGSEHWRKSSLKLQWFYLMRCTRRISGTRLRSFYISVRAVRRTRIPMKCSTASCSSPSASRAHWRLSTSTDLLLRDRTGHRRSRAHALPQLGLHAV
jgi:hypothetical protein